MFVASSVVCTHKLPSSLAEHFEDCYQLGQHPSLPSCFDVNQHCPGRTHTCYCLRVRRQIHFGNLLLRRSWSSHLGCFSVNACPLFDYSCGARSSESVNAFFAARPNFHLHHTLMHHCHSSWTRLNLASASHESCYSDAPRALHVKDLRSLVGLLMQTTFLTWRISLERANR